MQICLAECSVLDRFRSMPLGGFRGFVTKSLFLLNLLTSFCSLVAKSCWMYVLEIEIGDRHDIRLPALLLLLYVAATNKAASKGLATRQDQQAHNYKQLHRRGRRKGTSDPPLFAFAKHLCCPLHIQQNNFLARRNLFFRLHRSVGAHHTKEREDARQKFTPLWSLIDSRV